jgi:hypothetical protein
VSMDESRAAGLQRGVGTGAPMIYPNSGWASTPGSSTCFLG